MNDIALLGIKVDSATTAKAAADLDRMTASAGRADVAVDRVGTASTRASKGMSGAATQSRMVAQQLSQVAQQSMATGNFMQALAIQLPDMALGFGAVGIAAGVVAGVTLPLLASALGTSTKLSEEAAAATKRLADAHTGLAQAIAAAQGDIDKLRFGVDESYQVELLKEQIRLQSEYNGKVAELQGYLGTTTDSLDRQRITAEALKASIQETADAYNRNAASLSAQQDRSTQLAILEGIKAQRAGETAAKQENAAAALARQAQSITSVYANYAKTRTEGDKLAAAAERAGISAAQLASLNFGNIADALAYANGLAAAMSSAAAYAETLSKTGQSSGPDSVRSSLNGGGRFTPVVRGAGLRDVPASGGGGGGGAGDDFASRLEQMMQQHRTETEIANQWYAEAQALLADRRSVEILGATEHKAKLLEIERIHQEEIAQINANAYAARLSQSAGLFGALAGIAEAGGKKTAKAVAAFQAIEGTINAYGAAVKALNTPGLSLPGRFAAYASVLAAGLKGVAAIRSAGGIGGGGGGGRVAAQGTAAAPAQRSSELVVHVSENALLTAGMWSKIFDGVLKEGKDRGMDSFNGIRFA